MLESLCVNTEEHLAWFLVVRLFLFFKDKGRNEHSHSLTSGLLTHPLVKLHREAVVPPGRSRRWQKSPGDGQSQPPS